MAAAMSSTSTRSSPLTYWDKSIGTGDTVAGAFLGTLPQALITDKGLQTPEQQALLRKLLEALGAQVSGTPYTGELTAGLSDLEGLSLEALEQKILQQATGEGVGGKAESALSRVLQTGGGPTNFEEYYQKSIRDPLTREFSEMVLPELTRRYGSSGAFGSDRMLAEQRATEGLGRTLAGARGELAFKTQESAMDRMLKAIGLAPGLQTSGVDDLMKMLQGSALPRQIEQTRLTSEYGEFQRQETERQARVEQIIKALGIKTKENIPQSIPGTTGLLGGMLGAMGGGGSGGGFF